MCTNPERLTKPLIRKAGVPKGRTSDRSGQPLDPFPRGELGGGAGFRRPGLRTIRDRDGRKALAGFGSAKCSNEEAYLFQKLVRTGFGTNNVDHCTRLCHASSVAALMEGIGSGAVTAPFTACKNSDVIIVIGANPTENHPVAATYFKQAAKRGAKLIVMDPRGTALKRHATHMLQFKNGTDVALLNAMLNVIVDRGALRHAIHPGPYRGLRALGERHAVHAGGDGAGVRHRCRHPPHRCPQICPGRMRRSSSGAWAFRSTPMAPTMPAA